MRLLETEEVALRWNEIEPRISKALHHGIGECSSFDLFLDCMGGNSQCWEHEGLVAITRFNHFPKYKQLQIVAIEGRFFVTDWEYCLEFLESFAKEMGCRNVSVWGRPGWKRLLKDYHEPYAVLVKEV